MTYNAVATRDKMEGVVDKLAIMRAMAEKWAVDRRFGEAVLATLADCPSAADGQIECLERYAAGLPYRRERAEIYRSPLSVWGEPQNGVRGHGGDCDDLVIALAAAGMHLSLPVRMEIVADEQGWGFHVRLRFGLPPSRPTHWPIVDPVWRSERQWAMADRPVEESNLVKRDPSSAQTGRAGAATAASSSSKSSQPSRVILWAAIFFAGLVVGTFVGNQPAPLPRPKRSRRRTTRRSRA